MKKIISSIIFCVVISVVSCTIFATIIQNRLSSINTKLTTVAYDGSTDYPFNEATENVSEGKTTNKALRKFNSIKSYFEDMSTISYTYKMPFVLTKKIWDKSMGLDLSTSLSANKEDTVVSLGDGRLIEIMYDFPHNDAESLIEFGKSVRERGINFLLFLDPVKISEEDVIQSGIYQDHSLEFEKKYIEKIRKSGLEVLSVSEKIDEENLVKKDLFFKTDHHWLPQTALWANKVLCNYLNENMGFAIDTDIFSEENYDITYSENKWLGSLGKKVTEVYCDTEDFPIILPKYDTDITAFVSQKNNTFSGNIENIFFDWNVLEEDDIYKKLSYSFYARGDMALYSIHNNQLNDGKKILLIKLSYANPMIPYLSAAVENLDVIDLRHFKGSLQTYIDETKPDTVIMVYGTNNDGEFTSAYDFR